VTPSATDVRDSDRTVLITGGISPRVVVPQPRTTGGTAPDGGAREYSRGPADWRVEVLGSTALVCRGPW
jgi:hypothetical protein